MFYDKQLENSEVVFFFLNFIKEIFLERGDEEE